MAEKALETAELCSCVLQNETPYVLRNTESLSSCRCQNHETQADVCTQLFAGQQVPLTQASKEGGSSDATPSSASASVSASTAGGGSSSTSSGGVPGSLITNGPLLGAAVAAGGMLLAI
jgi:hypothetical protein